MTKKLLMVCVVGLMAAAPGVCLAVSIPAAVAAPGDGMYVQMDYGSSITLGFGTNCFGTDPAVILNFAQDSGGFYVDFYLGSTLLGTFDALELRPAGPYSVHWEAVPFDSVKVRAYGTLYLDAVQAGGTLVGGTYVAHTGTVTAKTDDPVVMIEDLVDLVASYNLVQGIDNSLDAKLAAAVDALEDVNANNDTSAANNLGAFIHEVEAQSGKKITEAQATELVGAAQKIIKILTAP